MQKCKMAICCPHALVWIKKSAQTMVYNIIAGTNIFVRTHWKCCCCHFHQINFFSIVPLFSQHTRAQVHIEWLMWLSMWLLLLLFLLSCWDCSACNHNFCFVLFCLYCAFDNNNSIRFSYGACEWRKRKIQANSQR